MAMRLSSLIIKIFDGLLVLIVVLLLLTVLWQIVSRYLLGEPSIFTEELARFLLIWLGLFGAARSFCDDGHISLPILVARLPDGFGKAAHMFRKAMIVLFTFLFFVIGGTFLAIMTWNLGQNSAALGMPVAIIYLALPMSGLLMFFYLLLKPGSAFGNTAGEQDNPL